MPQKTWQEIEKIGRLLYDGLKECRLCPRQCGVNRLKGKLGFCRAGAAAKVARSVPHMGEEPPISGTRGAGTIFFSHCHMACIYCQNYQISHLHHGREVSVEELAGLMWKLAQRGCHNIEWVSVTHFLPHAVLALAECMKNGLDLPVVMNSGGYESEDTLRLLEGIVDIYLPDAKYGNRRYGVNFSKAPDYPAINRTALNEMIRQIGAELVMDSSGIARQGIIIRHLVLPGCTEDSKDILEYIAFRYGGNVHVSLMSQYFPAFRAKEDAMLGRHLLPQEYEDVLKFAEICGLSNGWFQSHEPLKKDYYPDFLDNSIAVML
ncbi:MAG: radical SAM protein [Dissulfuribacterales bacterium]